MSMRRAILTIASIAFAAPLACRADLADDFHKIEGGLDDALLDTYSGTTVSTSAIDVAELLEGLKPYLRTAEALQLLDVDRGKSVHRCANRPGTCTNRAGGSVGNAPVPESGRSSRSLGVANPDYPSSIC